MKLYFILVTEENLDKTKHINAENLSKFLKLTNENVSLRFIHANSTIDTERRLNGKIPNELSNIWSQSYVLAEFLLWIQSVAIFKYIINIDIIALVSVSRY